MTDSPIVTRFAPSPTGHLHKGHAYSALQASRFARKLGGRFLLRIENIDFTRCKPENTDQILEDLAWLGIEWEEPVRVQGQHLADYESAANRLREEGFLYPCFCTRKDIERELAEAGQAPHSGTPLYPGTCRKLGPEERERRVVAGMEHCYRIDLQAALASIDIDLEWNDSVSGIQRAQPELLGDAILVRKDIATSYHLAVVVDDALQGITDVVRGVDLFESTHLHVVLQRLLGLPTPTYHHHPLLTDESGNRLAKRDRSITLKELRESGVTAEKLRAELGFS
ncbi:MAG: tRNA glutamyl-Q(34) synthetase GluQRS [Verrucomicrobiota bacterium]